MNGSPPPPVIPQASDFKDRRSGLIVFGILEIILGALAALIIPLMLLGQPGRDGCPPVNHTETPLLILFKTYFAKDRQFLSAE